MQREGGWSKSQFTDKPNCGKQLIVGKKRAEKYGEKVFFSKQNKAKKSEKQNKTKSANKWKKKCFFQSVEKQLINSE